VVSERTGFGIGTGKDVNHRNARPQRCLKLLGVRYFDNSNAHGSDGGIVLIARVRRDDDFIFRETAQIGNSDVQIRIASSNASGGRVGQAGGASRGNYSPLRAGQLRETLTDPIRELVELDVMLSGGLLRGCDVRQLERATNDGE